MESLIAGALINLLEHELSQVSPAVEQYVLEQIQGAMTHLATYLEGKLGGAV